MVSFGQDCVVRHDTGSFFAVYTAGVHVSFSRRELATGNRDTNPVPRSELQSGGTQIDIEQITRGIIAQPISRLRPNTKLGMITLRSAFILLLRFLFIGSH